MSNVMKVSVPDIGDFDDVPVIEVLVSEGESVDADQALIVLESDKSTMEVPAPASGVVRSLKVKVGDSVSQGHAICELEQGQAAQEKESEAAPQASTQAAPAQALDSGDSAQATEAASGDAPKASDKLQVTVPDIGDFENIPVIEILVTEGEQVEQDQALLVLESDKSTMEVPSPAAGQVEGLLVKVGDTVSEGDALLSLMSAASGAAAPKEAAAEAPPKEATPKADLPARKPPAKPAPSVALELEQAPRSQAHAGPATRKFARELGVDLGHVRGSGPKGRIVIEDVQRHVKERMAASAGSQSGGNGIPPIPAQDFSKFGEVQNKALSRIRKLSAAHLHRSWLNVPHVTQHDEADITELEAFRKSEAARSEVKLTLLPFVIKAVAVALKQYPEFNASLSAEGDSLILKQYCNIGFAADTPNGLVVPVIKDVWNKSISELAAEAGALAGKARDGKLRPDDMSGGCFSISSLGGIGGSFFTPIVNAPEVGILGVSRGVMKPVWNGSEFLPRLMVPLSLSYDHRVIDGAYAARFIVSLVSLLSDIRRLSL